MKDWHEKPRPHKNPVIRIWRTFIAHAELAILSILILYTICHAAILALLKLARFLSSLM